MIREAELRHELPETSANGVAVSVPIALIDPHPQQPRQHFDEAELQALADSMKVDDLLQRPIVRAMPNGRYQLVAGERRCRAAKLAGWANMPVIVRELSDLESFKLLGTENLLRKDWGTMETARYVATLCQPVNEGGIGMTHEQVGIMFGKSISWAAGHHRLLRLPEHWQERVAVGDVMYTQALKLLPYVEKKSIMAAIENDYKKSPWAWVTEEDFKRNVELVAASPKQARRPQVLRVPTAETSAPKGPGGRPPLTAVEKLTNASAKAAESPLPEMKAPATRVSTRVVCRVLKPYMGNRDMLIAIRDTCDQLLKEFHDAGVEAGEAVTL